MQDRKVSLKLLFGIVASLYLSSFLLGCGDASVKSKSNAGDPVSKSIPDNPQQKQSSPVNKAIDQAKTVAAGAFQPFYIYADAGSRLNHFIPSGFMPNGKCLTLNDKWREDCRDGQTCIRIEYDLECSREDQKWAGIYWLNPANNWGHRKGGFNLEGATQLTFWARGEQGGEQIEEFTIGGITGKFPDSDTTVMGPVILSNEWRQYTIDLRGKDLSYISGGFSWSTNEMVNQKSCTFYLDELKYE